MLLSDILAQVVPRPPVILPSLALIHLGTYSTRGLPEKNARNGCRYAASTLHLQKTPDIFS